MGSICAMLKCVSGVEVGASVGATPPSYSPLPLKGCIKEMGGEAPLSLCSQTLTGHTNTLDTRIPQAHTDYPEKRYFCVLDSPRGGPFGWTEKEEERDPAEPQ